jgi:DNA-binding protein YbaB
MGTPHPANQALWAQFDRLLTEYDKARTNLGTLQKEIGGIRGTADGEGGLVTVTVTLHGVTDLEISPRAYRRLSPSQLARTILEAIERARAKATAQAHELVAPFLPKDARLDDLVSGKVDVANWIPAEPLTPETFEDWWNRLGGHSGRAPGRPV